MQSVNRNNMYYTSHNNIGMISARSLSTSIFVFYVGDFVFLVKGVNYNMIREIRLEGAQISLNRRYKCL